MFQGFALLRALVFLRQIARELKRANDLTEARLENEHPSWYKSRVLGKRKGPTKLGEISTASVEGWNKAYERSHPQTPTDNPY